LLLIGVFNHAFVHIHIKWFDRIILINCFLSIWRIDFLSLHTWEGNYIFGTPNYIPISRFKMYFSAQVHIWSEKSYIFTTYLRNYEKKFILSLIRLRNPIEVFVNCWSIFPKANNILDLIDFIKFRSQFWILMRTFKHDVI